MAVQVTVDEDFAKMSVVGCSITEEEGYLIVDLDLTDVGEVFVD